MNGANLIARERERQIFEEGFDLEHDTRHDDGDLAIAGALYAIEGLDVDPTADWPSSVEFDNRKVHTTERRLVIAGALLAAEIDRRHAEADRRQAMPAEQTPAEKLAEENPGADAGAIDTAVSALPAEDVPGPADPPPGPPQAG